MEAYKITNKIASEQLQKKLNMHEGKHSERSAAKNYLYLPEKTPKRCTGFSYIGPKLYNMIPKNIKEAQTTNVFKSLLKEWIWKNIHPLMTSDYYYI